MGEVARKEAPNPGESSNSIRAEAFSEDKRNRSTSRGAKGRVEKRIEASVVEAEPAASARSRKSSHMMQLFKENNTPSEPRRAADKARKTLRSTSDGSITKRPESGRGQLHSEELPGYRVSHALGDDDGASRGHRKSLDGEERGAGTDVNIHRSRSLEENIHLPAATHGDQQPPGEKGNDSGRPEVSSVGKVFERRSDTSRTKLPSRLLEEIRSHHNFVAPINERFKTSQLKPQRRDIAETDLEAPLSGRKSTPESLGAVTDEVEEPSADTEDDLDEDSSDKELISSALYYPHQAPSPDALEGVSLEKGIGAKDAKLVLRLPKTEPISPTADEYEVSDDVDIALESQRQSRYLHGALQKEQVPADQATYPKGLDSGASSASESEYSNLTDDEETTPRATPSAAKGAFLRSRHRKGRRPRTAPLQAVELKPFRHQVGGHSTIFRFSRKAVCKQLSNKENEFYEIVEQAHPELLRFLPK